MDNGFVDENLATAERITENEVVQVIQNVNMRKGNQYIYLEDREQALMRPEMYIGNMTFKARKVYGFNAGVIAELSLTMCEGMVRLFIEALSNAGDNAEKTRRNGRDPGKVWVWLRPDRLTVRNEGDTIPIVSHPQFPDQYNPQVIFGQMRVSSTYGNTRTGAGTNGLGIKLANIFSTHFDIEVGDKENHALYKQSWIANMSQVAMPQIDFAYQGENYVQVSYITDFHRFNGSVNQYSPYELSHFAWLCAVLSATKQLEVILDYPELVTQYQQGPDGMQYPVMGMEVKTIPLNYKNKLDSNGVLIPVSGHESLALSMMGGRLIQRQKDTEAEELLKELQGKPIPEKRGRFGKKAVKKTEEFTDVVSFSIPSTEGFPYLAEVTLLNTPNAGSFSAFVNGPLPTPDGGEHVNALYKAFGDPLLEQMKKKLEQVKKEMEDTGGLTHLITISHIKKNISMLLSIHMLDPKFGNGQSKTKLDAFPFKITIPQKVAKILTTWAVGGELKKLLDNKFKAELKKTDCRRGSNLRVKSKLRNANEAGGPRSLQCTLWPTEGDSGFGYVLAAMKYLPGGWDYNGGIPLRGKVINPKNAEPWRLCKNKEYLMIKKAIGLSEGVDGEEAMKELNYGCLCICADADIDGDHIRGLIVNLMWLWPKLVSMGFIKYLRTPIKRVLYQGQWVSLYTKTHVDQMAEMTNNFKGLQVRYCKGLGTSNPEDIAMDMQNPYIVNLIADPQADYAINLVFDSKFIADRKNWMAQWQYQPVADGFQQTISEFIDRNMGEFSQYNLKRGVPNVCGHKPAILKILYATTMHWNYKPNGEFLTVDRFCNYVAMKVVYHHGPDSLGEAIIGMAQDYPGANNLHYFEYSGNVGSRDKNGKDHAQLRYPMVRPAWWFHLVFRKEDDPLLESKEIAQEDDGKLMEPKMMLSTIPMIAINGSLGIGSGWSTDVPPHRPLEVTQFLQDLILSRGTAKPRRRIDPWFRGFTGETQVMKKKSKTPELGKPTFTMDDNYVSPFSKTAPEPPKTLIVKRPAFGVVTEPTVNGAPVMPTSLPLPAEEHPQQNKIDEIAEQYFRQKGPRSEGERENAPESKYISLGRLQENGEMTADFIGNQPLPDEVGTILMSFGRFRQEGEKVIIDEIPIFTSIYAYDKFLDEMREAGIIRSKRTNSEPNKPYFEVMGLQKPNFHSLQLAIGKSMNNMTYLDEKDKPQKLNRVDNLIRAFYHVRLPWYYKRKQLMIDTSEKKLVQLKWKLYFVQLVNAGKIYVGNKTNVEKILAQMEPYKIPKEIFDKSKIPQLNEDGQKKLEKKIADEEVKLEQFKGLIPEQLWLNDIHEFEVAYKKHFKDWQKE